MTEARLSLLAAVLASAVSAQNPPSWVPAPGTFADISLNTMADADPCPANNCIYSEVSGQEGVFTLWNGGVFAPDYSALGALIVQGGGHNAYAGNEAYAFDLSTRLWIRIGSPSPYNETQIDTNGEYPDGQPKPSHTYDGVAYLSAANGGGGKGSFLKFGFAGNPAIQRVHRLPLATGPNTAGAWSRFANLNEAFQGDSYYAVAFDSTRDRFWVIGTLNSWGQGFGYVSASGSVTLLPYQGDNIGGDHVLGYCPRNDMLLHLWGNWATTPAGHLSGRLCSGSGSFRELTVTGPFPPAAAGLEWSTMGGYFVSYPGHQSDTVYILRPPPGDPLTGAWAWSTQVLTGANGATPSSSGVNGHYSRFREVPALGTPGNPAFVWADGRLNPVQLWRLADTGAARATPAPAQEASGHIEVFPNPVSGRTRVSFSGNPGGRDVRFRLLDTSGRQVLTRGPKEETSFDAGRLSPGVFLVEATVSGKIHYRKIVRVP